MEHRKKVVDMSIVLLMTIYAIWKNAVRIVHKLDESQQVPQILHRAKTQRLSATVSECCIKLALFCYPFL